uniref:T9SS type A sorting domain-containing protein n=1 Tax=candidate division WOR-3 bacterium TaxID=2052148 RepID=A0A7C4U726_UNCW3
MKNLFVFMFFALFVYGEYMDFEFYYPDDKLVIKKEMGYDRIYFEGAFETGDAGKSESYLIPYNVAIPPGCEIKDIEILGIKKRLIEGKFEIYPHQEPRPISDLSIGKDFIPLNEDFLKMKGPYPEKIIYGFTTGTKSGFQIGTFWVSPFIYYPSSRKVEMLEYIKVRVHFEKTHNVYGFSDVIVDNMCENVKEMVINSEDVDFYKSIIKSSPRKLSKALPSGYYEWVVICKKADTTAWKPLIEWKRKKGVPARFYLISDINANYTGANLAEKTKKFMDDAHNTWGTLWFLIGSHKDSLPNAPCYGYVPTVPATTDNNIASERFFEDLYKSGVYNDWDVDNDLLYGEWVADAPDILADCYVGRVCVKTTTDVQNFVNRVLFYEKTPVNDYLRKVLFFSEQLWSTNSEGYFHAEQLESKLGTAGINYLNYHEMYNELGYYPTDDSAVHSMNHGRGWTISYSHGDYITIMQGQLADKNITVPDLRTIPLAIEGNRWGIHTGICCMSGGYHERDTAYTKIWLIDRNGGVASIFNAEYGWGQDQEDTDTSAGNYKLSVGLVFRFVYYTYAFNKWHIGEALAKARDAHKRFITSESAEKWCLIEYNLQGDPEMPVWRDTTKALFTSHSTSIGTGTQVLTIHTYDAAKANVESSYVCIMSKIDTIYQRGYTNASGDISFTINPRFVNDTIFVTATKYKANYRPYEGSIIVLSTASIMMSGFVEGNTITIFWNAPSSFENFNVYIRKGENGFEKLMELGNTRNVKIRGLDEGEYSVFIEGGNSFISVTSETLNFTIYPIKPGIYDIKTNNDKIKFLFVSDKEKEGKIKILDITGRVIFEEERMLKTGNNFIVIEDSNMKNNIYFLMVEYENKIWTKKFILLK